MDGGESGGSLIDPFLVRFTQDSIGPTFRDGGTVADLIAALRSGVADPARIAPIRLFERDGILSSLDNRRLFAFRQANVPVPDRWATEEEVQRERWKFKPVDEGRTVHVRGARL